MAGRGQPKTGGRKPGVQNKLTRAKQEGLLQAEREIGAKLSEAEVRGLKAVDVLAMVMRQALKAGHTQLAVACAEKLAPYTSPRLASSTMDATVRRKSIKELSDEDLAAMIGDVSDTDQDDTKH